MGLDKHINCFCFNAMLTFQDVSHATNYFGFSYFVKAENILATCGVSRESYIFHAFKRRYYVKLTFTGIQGKMYYCSEPPQESEDVPGDGNLTHLSSAFVTKRYLDSGILWATLDVFLF